LAEEEVAAQGAGALGAAVEADMQSGGASREGAGAYLVGHGEAGGCVNEEVGYESNERGWRRAHALQRAARQRCARACVDNQGK